MAASHKIRAPLPNWVPAEARLYLSHTDEGRSLRQIAREKGVHASTVLRQMRRFENRRDDPLVNCALGRLRQVTGKTPDPDNKESRDMTLHIRTASRGPSAPLDEDLLNAEALRVLRRMAEPGVIMAVAEDMERAVVLRDAPDGAVRLAVLDRPVAEVFALRDWISCAKPGRVSRYMITTQGRAALRELIDGLDGGEDRDDDDAARARYCQTESPVVVLARRRDKDGKPFLGSDLVIAAERLREDFEVAQTGPRVGQDWDRFLTAGVAEGRRSAGSGGHGPAAARDRLAAALSELGPGLGDVALRCCCHLEGLEAAEQALGWSARSGKIVLRIALMRLKRHYDSLGDSAKMIG